MSLLTLFAKVADLSLMETMGLRNGPMGGIRRLVEPCPIEIRPGVWTWTGPNRMSLDGMRLIVKESAEWNIGDEVLLREPWRYCYVSDCGKQLVQCRADGEVAERGRGGSRVVLSNVAPSDDSEWQTASSMPEWSWRMKARVLGVEVSIVPIEPVGSVWSLVYEMKVMRHG